MISRCFVALSQGVELLDMKFTTLCFDVKKITGEMTGDGFAETTTAIENAGNSAIYIGMMIVGFLAVIGLLIAVVKIMVGGSMTKNEAKGSLFWICVGGIVGFGAIGIVGLMQTIAQGLF